MYKIFICEIGSIKFADEWDKNLENFEIKISPVTLTRIICEKKNDCHQFV